MSNPTTLQHKRIVVTRAECQSDSLVRLLREQGAEPVELPLIEFRPIVTADEAGDTTNRLSEFDWILFTSSNAIRFFFGLLANDSIPDQVKLACVGDKTASTLAEFAREPDFVPLSFTSRNLANEIEIRPGQKILYPCPKKFNSILPTTLEAKGAKVTCWPIYETLSIPLSADDLESLRSGFDAITFASPSAVDSFCQQIPDHKSMLDASSVACIGPMTRQRAGEHDLQVDVVPQDFNVPGLVAAIVEHFKKPSALGESS